ncbi:hypothetical protein VN97_g3691 [Penicillium thymicola]|uniref:Uncharacterized protein n=1 Tax=Penicillium thymicola TaxID=293382 RepID=A0AAI9XB17_PENTH|nr:hypothetical protein VN97_g3691 [Penicillium thymicola]
MFIFGVLAIPEFNATLSLICHQRYSIGRPPAHEPTEELKKCFANKHAQSDLSRFLIYGQATAGLLGAFATPILSSLSDRVGRKPILACTIVGPLLYDTLMVLVLRYPDWIDMHWLLVGYAIEGLSGTTITATATSQTYITDLTRHSAGARWFGYLQAAFSFAGAGGPIIAGLLLTTPNSIQLIYQLAMGAHISLLLFILFVLPESRSPDSISRRDRDGVYLGITSVPTEEYDHSSRDRDDHIWEYNRPTHATIGIPGILIRMGTGYAKLLFLYGLFMECSGFDVGISSSAGPGTPMEEGRYAESVDCLQFWGGWFDPGELCTTDDRLYGNRLLTSAEPLHRILFDRCLYCIYYASVDIMPHSANA